MQSAAEKLKGKSLKLTPQRLAIYDFLMNTDKHPGVEAIYKALIEQYPAISLATVYKTLDTFKKYGLVMELNTGVGAFRYDANCESHPHFICESCKSVIDMPVIERVDEAMRKAYSEFDFIIKNQQLYFYGICPHCAGNANTAD